MQQPYAELIARGEKWIENRSCAVKYCGPLAIHAARSRRRLRPGDEELYPDMTFGAIVAICRLEECYALEDITRKVEDSWVYKEILEHEYTEGPYCWLLGDVERLAEPIPIRGQLGLWNLPTALVERLRNLEAGPQGLTSDPEKMWMNFVGRSDY